MSVYHKFVIVWGVITVWNLTECQDCDTFRCLENFHDELLAAGENKTAVCSVAEDYLTCVNVATEACTTLDLTQQQKAAVIIKNISLCGQLSDSGTSCNRHPTMVLWYASTSLMAVYLAARWPNA